jgi:putative cardiolipin synthase
MVAAMGEWSYLCSGTWIRRVRRRPHAATAFMLCLTVILLVGCATLPPGSAFPKSPSTALATPGETRLGARFIAAASQHGGNSGYRILNVGLDGFLARAQLIDAAERTLDLQYYIFRGDDTGRLLTDALLRAADRGVRLRILVDDGDTEDGDEQIMALSAHASVEVRIFNPFSYRGHRRLLREADFLLHASRLNYRMHNKLMVADSTVALIGGRNIGDQYFQVDLDSQFADDDVFVAGPVAAQLSRTFDEFWNSALSIPAEAFRRKGTAPAAPLQRHRQERARALRTGENPPRDMDFRKLIAAGEPFAGILSGRLPLVWTQAEVVCDSPEKQRVENGSLSGRSISAPVMQAESSVQSELIIVSPYFVPSKDEMTMLQALRARGVQVRILTNSLESAPELLAHSGYMRYRAPLLNMGAEIHEIRSLLGSARGSGQTMAVSRFGNYALHAKLVVLDRKTLFVGSMNFDQRSRYINTEVGLLIRSAELAHEAANRFELMTKPENAYEVALAPGQSTRRPHLVWRTVEAGKVIDFTKEPAHSPWEREKVKLLSMLPLAPQL